MARLVFLAPARCEIAEIAAHLERETASRAVPETFTDKLVRPCERWGRLPLRQSSAVKR